jgi:hypothetical protein
MRIASSETSTMLPIVAKRKENLFPDGAELSVMTVAAAVASALCFSLYHAEARCDELGS